MVSLLCLLLSGLRSTHGIAHRCINFRAKKKKKRTDTTSDYWMFTFWCCSLMKTAHLTCVLYWTLYQCCKATNSNTSSKIKITANKIINSGSALLLNETPATPGADIVQPTIPPPSLYVLQYTALFLSTLSSFVMSVFKALRQQQQQKKKVYFHTSYQRNPSN